MTKNNSNWKTIEEEFINTYDSMERIPDVEGYYIEPKTILNFFKPYFQELEEKAWMYDELSK